MSFLSAAFLLALPLVAVPVAIHLYRGRQRDVIMWGAMQFLAAAATKGRRMERLEEWLLMAVRFAAVAVLVLALARPMIRSSWFGDGTDREVVLVLDNSLSMSRQVNGESSAERMKAAAVERLDSLGPSDGVQVLLAAGNEWVTAEPIAANSTGKQRLHEMIDAAEPTLGSAELLDSLQAAVHLEAPEATSDRRVIVFTDGQARSWQTDEQAAWQQLAVDRKEALPTTIEVVDCGSDAPIENLTVAEVRAVRNLVRPGEEAEAIATISNVGNDSRPESEVEWLIDDVVVQKAPLPALAASASTELSARLPLAGAGHHVVSCRIADSDQVPLDQENHVIVEVAERLPVLFVGEGKARDKSVSAPVLMSAALGFKNGEAQPWHSVFKPEVIEPAALATHSLADYRAVVINDVTDLSGETLERLDSYVRAGGGLWVAIGNDVDRVAFNRDWYSDGDGLSPTAIDSLEILEKPDDVAATVHPPSRDHPATMQLANTTQLDIDEARVRQRWMFAEQSPAEGGRAVSVLLESGNGRPLVVEKYVGHGRVLVQSFPLGLEWSNLPLLKAYVVMVHDWLEHVSAPTVARYNLERGAAIVAAAPEGKVDVKATLITPRGKEVSLSAASDEVSPTFRYAQTRLPGLYKVRFGAAGDSQVELPFHVAREASESELRPLADNDRTALLAPAGVMFAGTEPAQEVNVPRIQPREPFWTTLLAVLVSLLAVELLMSSWLSRRRSGLAVSTV